MNSASRTQLVAILTAVALLATLASSLGISQVTASSLHSVAHVKHGGTLVIDNETGGLWTGSYNPFSASVNGESVGLVYEPLVYVNQLNGKITPWLATSYKWSNGNRTLAFTIRHGVKWTDGKPFSAADVAFTFNLMKKFPATDLQSVWTVLKSVRQAGGNRVVMMFKQAAVPYFYYIADQNFMVPQHIWSKIKNPVTYADKNPVGTGPFVLGSSTPQTITYVRNPHYWQPGKPYLDKVEYPAFTSNTTANAYLATGQADWGGQFIPSIKSYYINRDPSHNHYWFPPIANVDIYINQTVPLLNMKVVRQAMAYAIDRKRVSTIGEYGYEPPANQTGIVTPTFLSWYDSSMARKYNYGYNPAHAISLLQHAGFKRGSDGIFRTKSGKPLSFSIINIGGNTDWVASVQQVIVPDLQRVGIKVTLQDLSSTDYDNKLYTGHFQLGYDAPTPGPSPYYEFHNVLYGPNSAPIGQTAASNFERWRDPHTDQLLRAFASTTSPTKQHQIMNQLQAIMLNDVPVIPVTEQVDWYQWSTAKFAGWPTQANPYAAPAPYATPDWEVVLTNVHLK